MQSGSGMISPSKLRLKQLLIGSQRKKQGPNSDSSSKPLDSELINNTFLLAPNQASSFACDGGVDSLQSKGPVIPKADPTNSSSVHPFRMGEDDNLDNDSTGSSFEFHKGERSRSLQSKWNDAEKWIMSKQYLKKAGSLKRVDSRKPKEETTEVPAIRSVSMRDMGTEMTPIPSQEPSRSVTPVSSMTPLRSPTSSIPSTPRRAELSKQEVKLKTRREIVALGVQLGKMNIAAWASKDERDKGIADGEKVEQIENVKRATAWEEAEKSKHAARFKREEIRIHALESQQKLSLDAEMRKIEAQIEQMRAQAQAKMVKVALARQKSEEKRCLAEARKSQLAEKTAAQAEYIRQTGRIPSSPFHCCGWLE